MYELAAKVQHFGQTYKSIPLLMQSCGSVEVCHGKIRMRLRMRLLCSLQNGLFRLLAKNVEEAGT